MADVETTGPRVTPVPPDPRSTFRTETRPLDSHPARVVLTDEAGLRHLNDQLRLQQPNSNLVGQAVPIVRADGTHVYALTSSDPAAFDRAREILKQGVADNKVSRHTIGLEGPPITSLAQAELHAKQWGSHRQPLPGEAARHGREKAYQPYAPYNPHTDWASRDQRKPVQDQHGAKPRSAPIAFISGLISKLRPGQ